MFQIEIPKLFAAIGAFVSVIAFFMLLVLVLGEVREWLIQVRHEHLAKNFIAQLNHIRYYIGRISPETDLVLNEIITYWERGVTLKGDEIRTTLIEHLKEELNNEEL